MLSGCLRDFRNKPFPTRARIEYYKNTLTVLFHNGMTQNPDEYEPCLRAENVHLPQHGYFGISAATGGLADDHDVYHFLTTSLHQPGEIGEIHKMPDESEKLAKEYQAYQDKLDKQKEEYHKEHPEDKKADEFDDWFETDNQRELRQIWQSQTHMSDVLKELSRKMDEIIGRQERTMGLLSINAQQPQQQGAGAQPAQQIQHQQQQQLGTVISRHEVEAMIQNQNHFVGAIREIKSSLNDLQARTDNVLQNQARQPTAQVQSANGYDMQSLINQMHDGLNQIKQGISNVHQRYVLIHFLFHSFRTLSTSIIVFVDFFRLIQCINASGTSIMSNRKLSKCYIIPSSYSHSIMYIVGLLTVQVSTPNYSSKSLFCHSIENIHLFYSRSSRVLQRK